MNFTLQELKEIERALMLTHQILSEHTEHQENLDRMVVIEEILDRVRIVINHG